MPTNDFFDEQLDHSKAKHDILQQYLSAWFPIMTFYAKKSGSKVLRYVDGFAGQGEYESGQYGSPVIALKVVNQNNSLKNCGLTFEFLFFEETPERFSRLEQVIASISYPPCIIPKLECGKFETKLNTWLDLQKTSTAGMAPTFVFVDPFGPAGFSMELMNRILQFRSTEVLVTLNLHSAIQWCLEVPERHIVLDGLFGCHDWVQCRSLSDPSDKEDFLRELYRRKLGSAGNILTRDFRMKNKKGLTSYYLVYATHSSKGLEVMKNAMWHVDGSGSFEYSDITNPDQPYLFDNDQIAGEAYARELQVFFSGKTVSKKNLDDFTKQHQHYINKHLTVALNSLAGEDPPKVTVRGKKRGTGWPAETEFIFPLVV